MRDLLQPRPQKHGRGRRLTMFSVVCAVRLMIETDKKLTYLQIPTSLGIVNLIQKDPVGANSMLLCRPSKSRVSCVQRIYDYIDMVKSVGLGSEDVLVSILIPDE
ncbi:hypothetical protein EVAR_4640_1 [Eumeta japonica]|uniref:Uncharacterized protein n=1 Tax=Eumeta variegata TaxID=151549 RepID=A0A4C1SZB8_EUMVA|nr:hypothetical protein EVAR_4640_1 [Eumeta japonica]